MKIKWQDAAGLMAVAFFIGYLISNNESKQNNGNTVSEKEVYRTRIDTAISVVYVPLGPLNAKAAPNQIKTITLHDSIYKEACLDTLLTTDTTAIAPDTVSLCIAQNIFSIS